VEKIGVKLIGLTLDSIVEILKELAGEDFDEPVVPIEECNLQKIASSLKTPFLRPDKKNQKYNFCHKAALLFCFLIENHCCSNTNKRLAVVSLGTLADINGYYLDISDIKLYALAMSVTLLAKYGLFNEAVEEVELRLVDALETRAGRPLGNKQRKELKGEFIKFMSTRII